jgi:alcohol dehydrogenase
MFEPVTPFHAQLPVRIAFGDGVVAELPDALTALGATAALVVVEEPVAEHPSVVAALTAGEGAASRLDRVVKGPGEPTFALADELAERVREGRLDAVVGIGGGSALDVAKAARIAADQGGAISEYAAGARVPQPPRIGLVLCPTTAGTGSEVSGASVLTDTDADRKVGFGHPNMRAQHALVDPILTHGLPAAPTAHSGVDALAQAIGACTVRNSSPLSVAFGLEACHHVAHSLREAAADGADAEARRRMACASLTAGLAMNLSDCAADHALGEPSDGTADGSRAVRAVRRVLADVGFPTLAETGVVEDALPALVASATGEQSYNLEIDCHAWSAGEVEQAFRAALALDAR